jgi:hypothetical protein
MSGMCLNIIIVGIDQLKKLIKRYAVDTTEEAYTKLPCSGMNKVTDTLKPVLYFVFTVGSFSP